MNLLIQENVTTQKYSYVFQNLSILEEIVNQDDNSEYKFSPKDKENIKKAKNLLMNIGKISKQTIKGDTNSIFSKLLISNSFWVLVIFDSSFRYNAPKLMECFPS